MLLACLAYHIRATGAFPGHGAMGFVTLFSPAAWCELTLAPDSLLMVFVSDLVSVPHVLGDSVPRFWLHFLFLFLVIVPLSSRSARFARASASFSLRALAFYSCSARFAYAALRSSSLITLAVPSTSDLVERRAFASLLTFNRNRMCPSWREFLAIET